jgi:hypothetical protein
LGILLGKASEERLASLRSARPMGVYDDTVREELERRFAETVRGAERPSGWPPLAIPGALLSTLLEAAQRDACPEAAVDYYTRKMPALLVEQQRRDDRARELLWRPIGHAPRLREALDGLYRTLRDEAIDPAAFTGAPSAEELLRARPTVAALYAHSLFGSGLPLLGAYPAERAAYDGELDGDWDAVIDLRLSGNLVHELCHGPASAPATAPWMILESAAITLGVAARPAHIFPDEPGEAVPGVSLFVCLGSALARRWGRGALFRLLLGAPLAEVAGERAAAALTACAWQDWLRRREPPFAVHALSALEWIKLAELSPPPGDDLLGRAAATPWRELPWWREEAFSVAEIDEMLTSLCQVNVMAPTFRTQPAEPGRLFIDVEACRIATEKRPASIFAEPAFWLVPPPMARRLWERGARRVRIDGVTRAERGRAAQALFEWVLANRALPAEAEWIYSR